MIRVHGRLVAASAAAALLTLGAGLTVTHIAQANPAPSPTNAPIRASIDSTILKGYKWRGIGPDRGGRSIAVSGVHGRPKEAYFGATGGGLWKTTDGGVTWTPVTDGKIGSASVGAVAVAESNPDVVYIGMGESYIRGNIMPGDGVYKSSDGGKTWTHLGFQKSDAISAIRVSPTDPNVVFVADFGKYGAPSEERGVFKSTDGGKTWRKVLYRNPETGAIDLAIDAKNPNVMYAALWEAFRKEWQMSSGGPGSGLFKSTDGGETWTEITRNSGLPSGTDGRIGVTVSPADPNRVYALVENEHGGLYRSEDAGATWKLVNSDRSIRQRAFYYTRVIADPKTADQLYALNTSAFRSTDGGKTLTSVDGNTHGDFHDLWIDSDNPQHMVIANDGGGAITTDGGTQWTEEDFPTAQFYHVVATAHVPYYVCGSQQDSNEQCVSSAQRSGFRFRGAAADVFSPGGSEDGYIAPDPRNPDVFYSGTNANGGGFLTRLDRHTGEVREVSPYPRMFSGEESAVIKERWQWTYPIVFSPVDRKTLYASSQHLWKTTNDGQSWTRISPDLTRHDPKTMGPSGGPITRDMNGPEVYATIYSIAPSKRDMNVIWTGSDDGLIYLTKNGGATWTNVTPKEMPDFGRVSLIDVSSFDDGTAYVAVKRPLLDDRAPYIFRTRDYGKTWTKIVDGIRADDYVHAVREDPTRKGMLYAASQHGVYVSTDDGDHWQSLSLNLPDVPVVDLIVVGNDLAIATHGRGFYILDDIAPLRQPVTTTADVVLYPPAKATRSGDVVAIQYLLKKPVRHLTVDILDANGHLVRSLPDTAGRAVARMLGDTAKAPARGRRFGGGVDSLAHSAGLNTASWDLHYASASSFPNMILWGGSTTGPAAAPGTYTVRLTADGKTYTQPLVVQRNAAHEATDADLRAQTALALQIRDKVTEANNAVIQIRLLKKQVGERLAKSGDTQLHAAGDKLTNDLSAVEQEIYQVKNQSGQDPLNFPIKINNRLASLLTVVGAGDNRPIASAYPIFRDLSAELKVQTDKLRSVLASDLPPFNAAAKGAGVEAVTAK
ncbi:MAG TPA: glycosyl hydrolase [Gemmatimonadaceae bacterium]